MMYSNELVLKILTYIDNNLYTQISINDLVFVLNYNKDYIMRLFKREIGISIFTYINSKRIYNSLFSYNMNNSITKISIMYGFSSLEYYSEIFKKEIGVSPKKYQKFVNMKHNLPYNDICLIQDNIALLNKLISFVDNYKKNIIPNNTIKSLSIFKK